MVGKYKEDFCATCHKPCHVHRQKHVDMEPYGETHVQRVSYEESSVCCRDEVRQYNVLDMAEIAADAVPLGGVVKCNTHESEQCSLEFGITMEESEALIYIYSDDRFTVKPLKISSDPTYEQRANWLIYCWCEDLASEYANYSTEHYTSYEMRVEDNQVKLWWRL